MEKKYPLNTIYSYTETVLKENSDSISRLDNKISTFMGFSAILIRLAIDLPQTNAIESVSKIGIYFLLVTSIVIGAIGLNAQFTGKIGDPRELMSDEWFFNQPEDRHKAYAINSWINALDEFAETMKRKAQKLVTMIKCFVVATILFALNAGLDLYISSLKEYL